MEEDNIVTRLKFFMDSINISNSRFADQAGIPRPSLSQLLTGRNKKISDVIVKQIHDAFPQLSIMWLLFGEGPMLSMSGVTGSFDSRGVENPSENQEFPESDADIFGDSKENGLELPANVAQRAVFKSVANDKKSLENTSNQIKYRLKPRKAIRITVYYDDNSYESFEPAKN